MRCIELFPDLHHCIETVAKEEFWNSARKLMESEQENGELQQRAELLRAFLETTNFGKLRRESEEGLMQGKKVKFVISWQEGKPSYEMVTS